MTPKERLLKALSHQEPDRMPVDLRTTNVTTITLDTYKRLREYLGINQERRSVSLNWRRFFYVGIGD